MSKKFELGIGAAGVLVGLSLMISGKQMCRTSCWVDDIFRYALPDHLASLAGGMPWLTAGVAIICWATWKRPK